MHIFVHVCIGTLPGLTQKNINSILNKKKLWTISLSLYKHIYHYVQKVFRELVHHKVPMLWRHWCHVCLRPPHVVAPLTQLVELNGRSGVWCCLIHHMSRESGRSTSLEETTNPIRVPSPFDRDQYGGIRVAETVHHLCSQGNDLLLSPLVFH